MSKSKHPLIRKFLNKNLFKDFRIEDGTLCWGDNEFDINPHNIRNGIYDAKKMKTKAKYGSVKTYKLKDTDIPNHLTHPGGLLADEIKYRAITQKELADKTGLSPSTISNVLNGKSSITPDIAIKTGKYLDINPEFLMRLQFSYERNSMRIKQKKAIETSQAPASLKNKLLKTLQSIALDKTEMPNFKAVKFRQNNIEFHLSDGRIITIPLHYSVKLYQATKKQRQNYEINGQFIFWDDIDEIIGVKNLLDGSIIPDKH